MYIKIFHSKAFVLLVILSFFLLIANEAFPNRAELEPEEDFKPVVSVREGGKRKPSVQMEHFERLMDEGRKLYEEMDYQEAINKFYEAKNLAITIRQKADVFFYLSLSYYAAEEVEMDDCFEMIRKLIEVDYYRELDNLLCPPMYKELFLITKREYGVLRIQSNPSGADVYLYERKDSVGKTPLTIGLKEGSVKIKVKKGEKEKEDTFEIVAERQKISPVYSLKGRSYFLYIVGGIALAVAGIIIFIDGKPPKTGSIQINSSPTGAKVYLDGNDKGQTTNCTLANVSEGTHSLKLELELYGKWEGSVEVKEKETTNVSVTLAPYKYEFVTKWGSYGSGDGQFDFPYGITVDNSGYAYVADCENYRIQKFTSSGNFVTKWGSQGNGDGQFERPTGIVVDNSGYVYVTDTDNSRIQKFTSSGNFVTKWGSQGSGNGQFNCPENIAVDSSSSYVYVVDCNNSRIQKFTSSGSFVTKWGSQGSGNGQFEYPYGLAVDSSGYVYVADSNNSRIQKFTSSGSFVTKWGSLGVGDGQFSYPRGIAVDSSDYMYVTEWLNCRVQKFTSSGSFVTKWGSQGSGDGQFYKSSGIALDSSDNIYVADSHNHRIQKFRITTEIQKEAQITYTTYSNDSFLNRNPRPRSGLLRPPLLKNKQRLMNKNGREKEKR